LPERIGSDVVQKRLTDFGFPKVRTTFVLKSREKLAENLAKKAVKDVWYTGKRIRLNFDDEYLSNTIKVLKHEEWVGSWDKKGRPIVYIDDDVPEKFRPSLAIHETVEKYLWERYRLDPNAEGHEVAEEVEKRWFLKNLGTKKDWEDYSKLVERIHRKEMAWRK
jgi:hypothetical protein